MLRVKLNTNYTAIWIAIRRDREIIMSVCFFDAVKSKMMDQLTLDS